MAGRIDVSLNNILEIDTCHDFRDAKLNSYTRGIDRYLNITSNGRRHFFTEAPNPATQTLLEYLKQLEPNTLPLAQQTTAGIFIHAIGNGVIHTNVNPGLNRAQNFNYNNVVDGGAHAALALDADRYTHPENQDVGRGNIYVRAGDPPDDISITADISVKNHNGQRIRDNEISLFGIHDSNSMNGTVDEIFQQQTDQRDIPPELLLPNEPLNEIEEGIAHFGQNVRLACVIDRMTMTTAQPAHASVNAEYRGRGGDNNLFFKNCKIHTNESWGNIAHDIFTPFVDNFTRLTWKSGMKKKYLKDNLKITSVNGNLTLHCKGVSTNSASNLFSLMLVFCCLRDVYENRITPRDPAPNAAADFNDQSINIANRCLVGVGAGEAQSNQDDNSVFLARMVSLLDIKRLGDHGQCFYTLKRGSRQNERDPHINLHTTGDFWAGIHFGLVKGQMTQEIPPLLQRPNLTRLLVTKPTSFPPPTQPNIMFFGSNPPQTPAPAPAPAPAQHILSVLSTNMTSWVINDGLFTISRQVGDLVTLPGEFGIAQPPLDLDAIKIQALTMFENWCRQLVGGQFNDLEPTIQEIQADFSIIIRQQDEVDELIIFPHVFSDNLEDPDALQPRLANPEAGRVPRNYLVADTDFILILTPSPESTPGYGRSKRGREETSPVSPSHAVALRLQSPGLQSPPRNRGRSNFGKKQKRWVADLKGKKKFVRRQVFSMRKDLVTPSYFEKMTGADFWKLPVVK